MDNRPFLRVAEPRKGKKFLSVSQNGTKPKIRCIKSFGSAEKKENWIEAIKFLMPELEKWYLQQMDEHFEPMRK